MHDWLRSFAVLAGLAGASLVLASCQSTCSGDPRKDDLFCAQAGLSSGRYSQETSRLTGVANDSITKASAAKSESERAQRRAESSQARAAGLSSKQAAQNRQISALQSQVSALQRQLSSARAAGRSAEMQDLEVQIKKLKSDIAQLGGL